MTTAAMMTSTMQLTLTTHKSAADVIETRTKKSATGARKEGTSYSDDVDCNDSDEDDKPTKKCNKKGATKGPYHLRR
jgi:hypothetical protein